ncbi:MAG: hypothetical protein KBA55_13200, partial [Ruminococcus sp.]|nr:hypothetical protein [Ruminococcus sp.]
CRGDGNCGSPRAAPLQKQIFVGEPPSGSHNSHHPYTVLTGYPRTAKGGPYKKVALTITNKKCQRAKADYA